MKKHLWIVAFVVVCLALELKAQSAKSFSLSAIIEPFRLEVGFNKTTHLVFPFSIIGIDRGSAGILAQKATGVENILKVKADQKGFEETNLSVITSDGKLYSFLVCYSPNPAYLNVVLDSIQGQAPTGTLKQKATGTLGEALLAYYAKLVLRSEKNMHQSKAKEGGVSFAVKGIYVKENVLFLRLRLQNGSTIRFDIDQLRLFVRDKVQSRRTAVQEKEVEPLFTGSDTEIIGATTTNTFVLAVPAFTLPKDKLFIIEMTEKGGGRNLTLKIKGNHLLKARPLD